MYAIVYSIYLTLYGYYMSDHIYDSKYYNMSIIHITKRVLHIYYYI